MTWIPKKFIISGLYLLLSTFSSIYSSELGNLIKFDINNYDKWLRKAEKASDEIQSAMIAIGKELELQGRRSWCIVAEPKGKDSLSRKMRLEVYRITGSMDLEDVNDFVRASFIVLSLKDIKFVRNKMVEIFGTPIKEAESFSRPYISGYRDYRLVFKSNSGKIRRDLEEIEQWGEFYRIKFEVQIHVCNIMLVKEIDHLLYEIQRLVKQITVDFPWEKVLRKSEIRQESFDSLYEDFKVYSEYLQSKKFKDLFKAWDKWNTDKNNIENISNLMKEITPLQKHIFLSAWKDYIKEESRNRFHCNLNGINNESCTLENEDDLVVAGLDYLKRLWR